MGFFNNIFNSTNYAREFKTAWESGADINEAWIKWTDAKSIDNKDANYRLSKVMLYGLSKIDGKNLPESATENITDRNVDSEYHLGLIKKPSDSSLHRWFIEESTKLYTKLESDKNVYTYAREFKSICESSDNLLPDLSKLMDKWKSDEYCRTHNDSNFFYALVIYEIMTSTRQTLDVIAVKANYLSAIDSRPVELDVHLWFVREATSLMDL